MALPDKALAEAFFWGAAAALVSLDVLNNTRRPKIPLLLHSVATLSGTWALSNLLSDLGIFAWCAIQGAFTLAMVVTGFCLGDGQRRVAVQAYRSQRQQWETQGLALEKLKTVESALEAKLSQRTHELHLAVQRLETLGAQDGLTGVANRRRFDEMLKVECGRAARARQTVSVALINVDWFERFNGLYGHEAGDACLCKLARVLESGVMRNGDLIARYGGGTFGLLTPDTDTNGIFSIANYLRQEAYGLAIPHANSPFNRVSISVGVASAHAETGISQDVLIQRAAEALASAKRQGHHRVVAAS
jgi:diguanylate cyclase (GGDEF)-like protein